MDILPELNENEQSNSNGESEVKAESSETIMIFGEEGLHYSDFESEEMNGELVNGKQDDDEYTSLNSLKNFTRKRTRNFTQHECNILCTLIEDYSAILEIKRNNHKTNILKSKAWIEITRKFNNSTTEAYRTVLQLRTFYENLKKKRKKLHKETENGDVTDISSHTYEHHNVKRQTRVVDDNERHDSLIDEYHRKKIELVEREIEKVKAACEQQRRLFLLQEEKLMLEIEEIKERLKNN